MNRLNIIGLVLTVGGGLVVSSANAESYEFHTRVSGLSPAPKTGGMAPKQQTINNYNLASNSKPGPPILLGKATYQKTDVFDMDAILIPLDDARQYGGMSVGFISEDGEQKTVWEWSDYRTNSTNFLLERCFEPAYSYTPAKPPVEGSDMHLQITYDSSILIIKGERKTCYYDTSLDPNATFSVGVWMAKTIYGATDKAFQIEYSLK